MVGLMEVLIEGLVEGVVEQACHVARGSASPLSWASTATKLLNGRLTLHWTCPQRRWINTCCTPLDLNEVVLKGPMAARSHEREP